MSRRARTAAALAVVLAAGLASRRVEGVPSIVEDHAGDALWATAVVLGLAIVRAAPAALLAAGGLGIAVAVELTQLWTPSWLEDLRENDLAALVLGRGWLWGDLVRYAVGAALGYLLLRALGYDDEPDSAVVAPRPR
ncbi:MAG: DUF2809 domain-containing protein [Actinomycetota bacterium]